MTNDFCIAAEPFPRGGGTILRTAEAPFWPGMTVVAMYISTSPLLILSACSHRVDACTETVSVDHTYGGSSGFFTVSLHDVPGGLYHAHGHVMTLHLSSLVMC